VMGVDAARPSAAPEAVQQVAALRPLLSAMQRPQPQARHPLQLLKHSSGGWTAFASAAGEGTGAGKGDGGGLRLPRLPPLLSSPPLPSPLLSSPPLPSPPVLPPPGASHNAPALQAPQLAVTLSLPLPVPLPAL
jgi:hypothetical protein